MRGALVSLLLICMLVGPGAADPSSADTLVDGCGATVAGRGYLAADLDCTGYDGPAVHLFSKSVLDLAGFTISGGLSDAVVCEGRCEVEGRGGTITGAARNGISIRGRKFEARDLIVSHNGRAGIFDASEADPAAFGNRTRARLERVTLTSNGRQGVLAKQVEFEGTAHLNGMSGVRCWRKCRIRNSSCRANGFQGVSGGGRSRIDVEGSVIAENLDYGIGNARRVRLRDSFVFWNWTAGVRAKNVRASDSTLFENNFSPTCDEGAVCADLVTTRKPRLEATDCDRSALEKIVKGGFSSDIGYPHVLNPWGVCLLD